MNWKDTTSYSRTDKERKATTWETDIGTLKICVTKGHIYYPNLWVMHCHDVRIDTMPLQKANSETEAQEMAIQIVRARVAKWQSALNALTKGKENE